MSDLKSNIQEDKDVESVSDSPGCAKEPLWSSTFSLKNNPIHTIGLSSDEHHKPLNGAQPNPFVYSSVPAVPCVDNSLPSGALVNGPGSHPTTEVHSVLNKGTVLSNNVLDAAWQVEKDTSAEVLPPPSELQSDAWKNTVGISVKTLATQPGVNTPLSHSEENGSKLAYSALSGDGAEQMNISQPWTQQTIGTGIQHSVEWSESSTDDYDDVEVIKWDLTRECLLHNDGGLETSRIHQREMQHNTHGKSMAGSLEKVNNSLNHTPRRFCSGNDVENVDIANKSDSLDTECAVEYSVLPFKSLPASNSEQHIHSAAQNGCNEEDDPEDEDTFRPKVEQLKTKQLGQDLSFFSCTICNVNFRGKRNFHRHMMYHLGKHNQVNSENVSQTFICRECGRLFCDRNSLMRHIIIHQDRLEKLMEEIKDLKNTDAEDRGATVHCPQCEFGCSCPKISVQHAETHDNLKHYYFCEECNYITLTQQALELHLRVAHLDSHQPQFRKMTHTNDAEEVDHVHFHCKMGFFRSRDTVVVGRHSDLENQPSHSGNSKNSSGQPKIAGCKANRSKSTFGELAHLPHCSSENEDIYIQKSEDKTKNSLFKHYVDDNKNTLSPSLWRIGKHGKLLLQPVEKLDVATDLTCAEENAEKNDHEAFGNSKQANCPATADASPSSRSLKLEQMLSQDSKNDLDRSSQAKANQNSASMIKMATPLQNTIDMNGNILPRLSQRCKNHSADGRLEKDCESVHNFSGNTNRATGSFLESSENERNPYARKYIQKRQRLSGKTHQSPHQLTDEDEGDEDCSDIEQLIIKEEYIETTVCDTSPESPCTPTSDNFVASPSQVIEHKVCPYCPAMFESGVGLSNHVRGHLHRVGLSYNARHMVSPEQVALQDHQPRTRRRIPAGRRKIRRAVKTETQGEHTCPLCCGWFDTRTGLSNHVRGHLKRIGRSVTSTSKSPLCILNELLQDKEEHRNILQVLEKDQFLSGPSAAQKFISRSGLVLMHAALPAEIIQHEMKSQHTTGDRFFPKQEAQVSSEKDKLQENGQRGITRSSSTLVELLKMRQESMELAARNNQDAYPVSKLCVMTKDYKETQMTGVEPERTSGECDLSEICHDCNSNFPAAVSLSGHLQAYACRKRIAVFEETGYDYKQKKPRPRPGLKKKILPSLNAQIYTLTCRFCDLVFQGPLSIQEDWVKHLQRHLLHTSVPHSGTGMVEVLGPRHKLQISMTHEHPDAR